MSNHSLAIFQCFWNYYAVLRGDGLFYGDYVDCRVPGTFIDAEVARSGDRPQLVI